MQTLDIWLPTQHEIPIGVGIKDPINRPTFDDILSGKQRLILFGRVVYRDRFQRGRASRYSDFCFELDPTRIPGEPPDSFGFKVVPRGYNDAT